MSSNKMTTPTSQNSAPRDGGVKIKADDSNRVRNLDAPNWRGPATTSGNLADEADPFVDAGSQTANGFGGVNLSATAKAFKPTTSTVATPVGVLSVGTEADGPVIVSSTRASMAATTSSRPAAMAPIGSKSQSASPPRTPVRFSTDVDHPGTTGTGGHFLQVQGVHGKDLGTDGIFTKLNTMPQYEEHVRQKGKFDVCKVSETMSDFVVIIFSNSLEFTTKLFHLLDAEGQLNCQFIPQQVYAGSINVGAPPQYCGQITLKAQYKGLTSKFAQGRIDSAVEATLKKFGKLIAFKAASEAEFPAMKYRAEFDSVAAAMKAVASLNQVGTISEGGIENLIIEVFQYEPPTFSNTSGTRAASTAARHSSGGTISPTTLATPSTSRSDSTSKVVIYSPTGRTAEREDANGNMVAVPGNIQVERCERTSQDADPPLYPGIMPMTIPHTGVPISQAPFNPGQQFEAWDPHSQYHLRKSSDGTNMDHRMIGPQDVDVQRIVDGHDVRTTLMIRNVPTDWQSPQLEVCLKDVTFGLYDFSYLRIDFTQSKAVGYAFVNFVSANALLQFVQAKVGTPLPNIPGGKYNNKPCAVSYANIQGYECLVAKFRNSSIMKESSTCRPMLWHTEFTAPTPEQVGHQVDFPSPDNLAKLNRSIENAGSQGLYAPRPRGAGRDGRRQHSQFDRGTPGQVYDAQRFANYSSNNQYTWGPAPQVLNPYGQPMPMYGGHQHFMMPQQAYGMHGMHGMHFPQQFQQPTHFHGFNVQAASGLRTHTNGQLGYRYESLPAFIQPVGQPYGTNVVMNREADFEPIPTHNNNSTPRFFRERHNSSRGA